jgi:flotillin
MIAEVESVVMSDLAKVQAEVAVQTARIKQVKQQLQADVNRTCRGRMSTSDRKSPGGSGRNYRTGESASGRNQKTGCFLARSRK